MTTPKGPPKPTLVGRVAEPQKRKLKAVPAKELKLDRSLEDFAKWARNFGIQDSGHFRSKEDCDQWVNHLMSLMSVIESDSDFNLDVLSVTIFSWIEHMADAVEKTEENKRLSSPGHFPFTSAGACRDFLRQFKEYVETDGYIVNPNLKEKSNDTGNAPSRKKANGSAKKAAAKRRGRRR